MCGNCWTRHWLAEDYDAYDKAEADVRAMAALDLLTPEEKADVARMAHLARALPEARWSVWAKWGPLPRLDGFSGNLHATLEDYNLGPMKAYTPPWKGHAEIVASPMAEAFIERWNKLDEDVQMLILGLIWEDI